MACAELYLGHVFYTKTLERDLSKLAWPKGTRFVGSKEILPGKEWVFMVCHPDIDEDAELVRPRFEDGVFEAWNELSPMCQAREEERV